MDPLPFAEAAPQLVEVIRSRAAVLVIGAGASVSSGGPTASTFIELVKQKFPLADIEDHAGLLDAFTEVCNTPPYGRQGLIRFLKEYLEVLHPGNAHKQLPRWHWSAIFTTNYDDLIEKSYKTPGRKQTLEPVYPPNEPGIARPDHLYLFYLQGSINQPAPSEGAPAVSWPDYNRSLQNRIVVMNLLRNVLIQGGNVIYIGYSFNDFILSGLLEEAERRIGGSNQPYGYAILPEWPEQPAKHRRVTQYNVIPVAGTFEDFSALVQEVADHGYPASLEIEGIHSNPAAGYRVTVQGHRIAFTESEFGVYSEYFEVLEDAVVEAHEDTRRDVEQIREFLRGSPAGWAPFRHGWAFKRAGYKSVYDAVRAVVEDSGRADSKIILVHGPAGLGKSVMARQLAFDLFKTLATPVLIAKPGWRVRPDFRLVDRFFDDIEQKLPEEATVGPVVLVLDEAELVDRTLASRVTRYLASKGRELIVVLFARTNEYFRVARGPNLDTPAKWGQAIDVPVAESMTDDEIGELISHLSSLQIWSTPRITDKAFWIDHVNREHGGSFFDTVYALVEETQVPLRDRVVTEYHNLSDLGREAYRLIAALHQFGIMMKFEVLARALHVDFSRFERDVIRGDAQTVLIEEQVTSGLNINYRGRTRRISEVVFECAVPEHGDQLDIFLRVIRAFNPHDVFGVDELDALRTLLIQVLGPTGFDNRFSPDELVQLFDAATSVAEDDVLEHHFGLLEYHLGRRLLQARQHLEKALALSSLLSDDVSGLRESPQNIENSLAMVVGDLALEALDRGADHQAELLFEEASQHFHNARRGSFPNAAAYDAHARLILKRARKALPEGSPERVIALAGAIDILDEGLDNVNEEHRPGLVELKSQVLQDLGQETEAIAELSRRAGSGSGPERAKYHVILARLLLGPDECAKRKAIRKAWTHVIDACELDPLYFAAQKLRVELYRNLHPTDINGLNSILSEATRCPEAKDSPRIQYELGVVQFYRENYGEAARAFQRLRRVTRGSMIPPGQLELAGARMDDDEGAFEYRGRVINLAHGRLAIESEQLEALGPVWFNPRGERYYTPRLRDSVAFEIGFNYRGISALGLRRM
jgi:tetratricopeptide (TPR) repeat protein